MAVRARVPGAFGETLNHVGIAVDCALCYAREGHPDLFEAGRWPSLTAHATCCDALEEFKAIYQPLLVRLG